MTQVLELQSLTEAKLKKGQKQKGSSLSYQCGPSSGLSTFFC